MKTNVDNEQSDALHVIVGGGDVKGSALSFTKSFNSTAVPCQQTMKGSE